MEGWILGLEITFTTILAVMHCCSTYLVWKNREDQPIKSKSPGLLLLLSIAVGLSTLLLCGVLMASSIDVVNSMKQTTAILVLLAASEIIAAPTALCTYIARGAQLSRIYHVPKGYINTPLSEDEGYQRYGQKKYVRYVLCIAFLAFICGIWFIVYILYKINNAELPILIFILNLITLIAGALSQFFMFICASSLLHRLYEVISMGFELLVSLMVTFVGSTFYHALSLSLINEHDQENFLTTTTFCVLALLGRNLAWVVVSIIYPLMQSKDCLIISYNETRECAKSLEVVTCSRMAYLYFSHYIETKCKPEGYKVLDLFNLLMIRKEKIKKGGRVGEVESEITKIYNSDANLKAVLDIRRNAKPGQPNTYDRLMDAVIEKMQEYFIAFRQSRYYDRLIKSLTVREIINERLQLANLL